MNNTPSANRTTIALFGRRNAGKSSLLNAITSQEIAVVSDIPGTTTDPVKKSMELFPLGPVTIIDTPGFDDEGALGEKRIKKTGEIIDKSDVAVLVVPADNPIFSKSDEHLLKLFKEKNIPYLICFSKGELKEKDFTLPSDAILTSSNTGLGIEELKTKLGAFLPEEKKISLVSDFIKKGTYAVLVCPIDSSAPKGRIILPQQQAIRDILDKHHKTVVCQETELEEVLSDLNGKVSLVVTDSQVFKEVDRIVPKDIMLTSFSILFARIKGVLNWAKKGADVLDLLLDNDKVLISEGCTHHRQCEDIGTVKLPFWIEKYTGKKIDFSFTSGGEFPEDLSKFRLVVHCGGCMLSDREMENRLNRAKAQNVPITNYGVLIAKMSGCLDRGI